MLIEERGRLVSGRPRRLVVFLLLVIALFAVVLVRFAVVLRLFALRRGGGRIGLSRGGGVGRRARGGRVRCRGNGGIDGGRLTRRGGGRSVYGRGRRFLRRLRRRFLGIALRTVVF